NRKVGPIPVTTSSDDTCPDNCPLKAKGCYARYGILGMHWRKLNASENALTFEQLCERVRALPKGQAWRHNQAGDLPGKGDQIDFEALAELTRANRGKRGWTYTHKPMTADNQVAVSVANAFGFTINLSANNPAEADRLADLKVGPVVTVLPSDASGILHTPAGRRIVVCPATYREDVTCASCMLCAQANRTYKDHDVLGQPQKELIVGFPAHGAAQKHVDQIAANSQ
ncbi:MAG: DUF7227 family protein, partial [bacterium]